MISENKMSEHIKAGAEKALLELCDQRLWTARKLLEEAVKDKFINFSDRVEKAREMIDEAEQLHKRTYNL